MLWLIGFGTLAGSGLLWFLLDHRISGWLQRHDELNADLNSMLRSEPDGWESPDGRTWRALLDVTAQSLSRLRRYQELRRSGSLSLDIAAARGAIIGVFIGIAALALAVIGEVYFEEVEPSYQWDGEVLPPSHE